MKIVLVGAGGYGKRYVDYLLDNDISPIKLEGIVEKYFDRCPSKEKIINSGVPVYDSLLEFYKEHDADLAVIVTPSYLHCEQSICALQHNSYVLCEKPIAPTVEEAEKMFMAEKEYGKFIAIGYQWSFSEAIQNLKKDILIGKLGKPLALKTIVSWPRGKAYYSRGGGWAGKVSKDGIVVLDSIASNACAHYIHNMFFVLGKSMDESAIPSFVEAECIRANDIETFDTCILRMSMNNGVKLYFAATHAAKEELNPEFVYEFENATVEFKADVKSNIVAYFKDGKVINYGDPFKELLKKFRDSVDAINDNAIPICTVKTATPHTRLINAIHDNVRIAEFPNEIVKECNNQMCVEGLYEKICECYKTQSMFSEKGYNFVEKCEFHI